MAVGEEVAAGAQVGAAGLQRPKPPAGGAQAPNSMNAATEWGTCVAAGVAWQSASKRQPSVTRSDQV